MVAINPEMLRELLDEFTEKEAVTREEINIITSQIEELELRIESNKEKLASLVRDKEKVNSMQERYLQGNWPKVYKTEESPSDGAAPAAASQTADVAPAAPAVSAPTPEPAPAPGPAVSEPAPAPVEAAPVAVEAAPPIAEAAPASEPKAVEPVEAPPASVPNPSLSSGSFPTLSAVHSQASINAAKASATGLPSMAQDAWGAVPEPQVAAAPSAPAMSDQPFGLPSEPASAEDFVVGASTTDNPVIDLQDAVTMEPEAPALPSDDPILSSFNSPQPTSNFSFDQLGQNADTASGAAAASADEGFSWASTSLPAGEVNNSQPSTTERLEQPAVLPWGAPPQTQPDAAPVLDAWGVAVQPAAPSPWADPSPSPTQAPANEPAQQPQADQTSTGGWGQGVWGEPAGAARPAPAPAAPWGTPGSSMTGMPAQPAAEAPAPVVQSWEQPAPTNAAPANVPVDTWGQPNPNASAQSAWGTPAAPAASQAQSAWGNPEPSAAPAPAPEQAPPAGQSSLARAADGALSPGRGRKRESPAFDWGQSESAAGDPANPQGGSSEEDENVKKLGDKLKGLFNK